MDLDGDGYLDVVSGSWPGEIFFFKGGPNRNFAAPTKLKNKDGKSINIGGGKRESSDEMILIAGDAQFKKEDGKTFIVYEGETIEVPKGRSAGITGTASAVHVVDWDGDGLLDLIVGEIGGSVSFVRNEGTKSNYVFGKEQALEAAGKAIRAPGGDAGPHVVDWDADGLLDLLVGCGDGSVKLYRNIGTRKEPKLAEPSFLVPEGKTDYGPDAPKEPRRGVRAKVWAADWNSDGKLDLLVGDFATQKPDLPEPTAAEKEEHAKLRKELDDVIANYRKIVTKLHGKDRPKVEKEAEDMQKELNDNVNRMQELQKKLPPEYENHGWVWLFLRK